MPVTAFGFLFPPDLFPRNEFTCSVSISRKCRWAEMQVRLRLMNQYDKSINYITAQITYLYVDNKQII